MSVRQSKIIEVSQAVSITLTAKNIQRITIDSAATQDDGATVTVSFVQGGRTVTQTGTLHLVYEYSPEAPNIREWRVILSDGRVINLTQSDLDKVVVRSKQRKAKEAPQASPVKIISVTLDEGQELKIGGLLTVVVQQADGTVKTVKTPIRYVSKDKNPLITEWLVQIDGQNIWISTKDIRLPDQKNTDKQEQITPLPTPPLQPSVDAFFPEVSSSVGDKPPEVLEVQDVRVLVSTEIGEERGSATDRGNTRETNEDAVVRFEVISKDGKRLFAGWVVADGMGGQPNGEVVSRIVATSFPTLFAERNEQDLQRRIQATLVEIQALLKKSVTEEVLSEKAGATVAGVIAGPKDLILFALGDARAVVIDEGGRIIAETDEQSFPAALHKRGAISLDQAAVHNNTNPTEWLSATSQLQPTFTTVSQEEMNRNPLMRVVLYTDGLSNAWKGYNPYERGFFFEKGGRELVLAQAASGTVNDAAKYLIAAAKTPRHVTSQSGIKSANGRPISVSGVVGQGDDNVSVVVIEPAPMYHGDNFGVVSPIVSVRKPIESVENPTLQTARVGRDVSNEVVLSDPLVSRFHAVLELKNGTLSVNDNGSTNGTFVGGKKIKSNRKYQLKDGDKITFGTQEYTISIKPGEPVQLLTQEGNAGVITIPLVYPKNGPGKEPGKAAHNLFSIFPGVFLAPPLAQAGYGLLLTTIVSAILSFVIDLAGPLLLRHAKLKAFLDGLNAYVVPLMAAVGFYMIAGNWYASAGALSTFVFQMIARGPAKRLFARIAGIVPNLHRLFALFRRFAHLAIVAISVLALLAMQFIVPVKRGQQRSSSVNTPTATVVSPQEKATEQLPEEEVGVPSLSAPSENAPSENASSGQIVLSQDPRAVPAGTQTPQPLTAPDSQFIRIDSVVLQQPLAGDQEIANVLPKIVAMLESNSVDEANAFGEKKTNPNIDIKEAQALARRAQYWWRVAKSERLEDRRQYLGAILVRMLQLYSSSSPKPMLFEEPDGTKRVSWRELRVETDKGRFNTSNNTIKFVTDPWGTSEDTITLSWGDIWIRIPYKQTGQKRAEPLSPLTYLEPGMRLDKGKTTLFVADVNVELGVMDIVSVESDGTIDLGRFTQDQFEEKFGPLDEFYQQIQVQKKEEYISLELSADSIGNDFVPVPDNTWIAEHEQISLTGVRVDAATLQLINALTAASPNDRFSFDPTMYASSQYPEKRITLMVPTDRSGTQYKMVTVILRFIDRNATVLHLRAFVEGVLASGAVFGADMPEELKIEIVPSIEGDLKGKSIKPLMIPITLPDGQQGWGRSATILVAINPSNSILDALETTWMGSLPFARSFDQETAYMLGFLHEMWHTISGFSLQNTLGGKPTLVYTSSIEEAYERVFFTGAYLRIAPDGTTSVQLINSLPDDEDGVVYVPFSAFALTNKTFTSYAKRYQQYLEDLSHETSSDNFAIFMTNPSLLDPYTRGFFDWVALGRDPLAYSPFVLDETDRVVLMSEEQLKRYLKSGDVSSDARTYLIVRALFIDAARALSRPDCFALTPVSLRVYAQTGNGGPSACPLRDMSFFRVLRLAVQTKDPQVLRTWWFEQASRWSNLLRGVMPRTLTVWQRAKDWWGQSSSLGIIHPFFRFLMPSSANTLSTTSDAMTKQYERIANYLVRGFHPDNAEAQRKIRERLLEPRNRFVLNFIADHLLDYYFQRDRLPIDSFELASGESGSKELRETLIKNHNDTHTPQTVWKSSALPFLQGLGGKVVEVFEVQPVPEAGLTSQQRRQIWDMELRLIASQDLFTQSNTPFVLVRLNDYQFAVMNMRPDQVNPVNIRQALGKLSTIRRRTVHDPNGPNNTGTGYGQLPRIPITFYTPEEIKARGIRFGAASLDAPMVKKFLYVAAMGRTFISADGSDTEIPDNVLTNPDRREKLREQNDWYKQMMEQLESDPFFAMYPEYLEYISRLGAAIAADDVLDGTAAQLESKYNSRGYDVRVKVFGDRRSVVQAARERYGENFTIVEVNVDETLRLVSSKYGYEEGDKLIQTLFEKLASQVFEGLRLENMLVYRETATRYYVVLNVHYPLDTEKLQNALFESYNPHTVKRVNGNVEETEEFFVLPIVTMSHVTIPSYFTLQDAEREFAKKQDDLGKYRDVKMRSAIRKFFVTEESRKPFQWEWLFAFLRRGSISEELAKFGAPADDRMAAVMHVIGQSPDYRLVQEALAHQTRYDKIWEKKIKTLESGNNSLWYQMGNELRGIVPLPARAIYAFLEALFSKLPERRGNRPGKEGKPAGLAATKEKPLANSAADKLRAFESYMSTWSLRVVGERNFGSALPVGMVSDAQLVGFRAMAAYLVNGYIRDYTNPYPGVQRILGDYDPNSAEVRREGGPTKPVRVAFYERNPNPGFFDGVLDSVARMLYINRHTGVWKSVEIQPKSIRQYVAGEYLAAVSAKEKASKERKLSKEEHAQFDARIGQAFDAAVKQLERDLQDKFVAAASETKRPKNLVFAAALDPLSIVEMPKLFEKVGAATVFAMTPDREPMVFFDHLVLEGNPGTDIRDIIMHSVRDMVVEVHSIPRIVIHKKEPRMTVRAEDLPRNVSFEVVMIAVGYAMRRQGYPAINTVVSTGSLSDRVTLAAVSVLQRLRAQAVRVSIEQAHSEYGLLDRVARVYYWRVGKLAEAIITALAENLPGLRNFVRILKGPLVTFIRRDYIGDPGMLTTMLSNISFDNNVPTIAILQDKHTGQTRLVMQGVQNDAVREEILQDIFDELNAIELKQERPWPKPKSFVRHILDWIQWRSRVARGESVRLASTSFESAVPQIKAAAYAISAVELQPVYDTTTLPGVNISFVGSTITVSTDVLTFTLRKDPKGKPNQLTDEEKSQIRNLVNQYEKIKQSLSRVPDNALGLSLLDSLMPDIFLNAHQSASTQTNIVSMQLFFETNGRLRVFQLKAPDNATLEGVRKGDADGKQFKGKWGISDVEDTNYLVFEQGIRDQISPEQYASLLRTIAASRTLEEAHAAIQSLFQYWFPYETDQSRFFTVINVPTVEQVQRIQNGKVFLLADPEFVDLVASVTERVNQQPRVERATVSIDVDASQSLVATWGYGVDFFRNGQRMPGYRAILSVGDVISVGSSGYRYEVQVTADNKIVLIHPKGYRVLEKTAPPKALVNISQGVIVVDGSGSPESTALIERMWPSAGGVKGRIVVPSEKGGLTVEGNFTIAHPSELFPTKLTYGQNESFRNFLLNQLALGVPYEIQDVGGKTIGQITRISPSRTMIRLFADFADKQDDVRIARSSRRSLPDQLKNDMDTAIRRVKASPRLAAVATTRLVGSMVYATGIIPVNKSVADTIGVSGTPTVWAIKLTISDQLYYEHLSTDERIAWVTRMIEESDEVFYAQHGFQADGRVYAKPMEAMLLPYSRNGRRQVSVAPSIGGANGTFVAKNGEYTMDDAVEQSYQFYATLDSMFHFQGKRITFIGQSTGARLVLLLASRLFSAQQLPANIRFELVAPYLLDKSQLTIFKGFWGMLYGVVNNEQVNISVRRTLLFLAKLPVFIFTTPDRVIVNDRLSNLGRDPAISDDSIIHRQNQQDIPFTTRWTKLILEAKSLDWDALPEVVRFAPMRIHVPQKENIVDHRYTLEFMDKHGLSERRVKVSYEKGHYPPLIVWAQTGRYLNFGEQPEEGPVEDEFKRLEFTAPLVGSLQRVNPNLGGQQTVADFVQRFAARIFPSDHNPCGGGAGIIRKVFAQDSVFCLSLRGGDWVELYTNKSLTSPSILSKLPERGYYVLYDTYTRAQNAPIRLQDIGRQSAFGTDKPMRGIPSGWYVAVYNEQGSLVGVIDTKAVEERLRQTTQTAKEAPFVTLMSAGLSREQNRGITAQTPHDLPLKWSRTVAGMSVSYQLENGAIVTIDSSEGQASEDLLAHLNTRAYELARKISTFDPAAYYLYQTREVELQKLIYEDIEALRNNSYIPQVAVSVVFPYRDKTGELRMLSYAIGSHGIAWVSQETEGPARLNDVFASFTLIAPPSETESRVADRVVSPRSRFIVGSEGFEKVVGTPQRQDVVAEILQSAATPEMARQQILEQLYVWGATKENDIIFHVIFDNNDPAFKPLFTEPSTVVVPPSTQVDDITQSAKTMIGAVEIVVEQHTLGGITVRVLNSNKKLFKNGNPVDSDSVPISLGDRISDEDGSEYEVDIDPKKGHMLLRDTRYIFDPVNAHEDDESKALSIVIGTTRNDDQGVVIGSESVSSIIAEYSRRADPKARTVSVTVGERSSAAVRPNNIVTEFLALPNITTDVWYPLFAHHGREVSEIGRIKRLPNGEVQVRIPPTQAGIEAKNNPSFPERIKKMFMQGPSNQSSGFDATPAWLKSIVDWIENFFRLFQMRGDLNASGQQRLWGRLRSGVSTLFAAVRRIFGGNKGVSISTITQQVGDAIKSGNAPVVNIRNTLQSFITPDTVRPIMEKQPGLDPAALEKVLVDHFVQEVVREHPEYGPPAVATESLESIVRERVREVLAARSSQTEPGEEPKPQPTPPVQKEGKGESIQYAPDIEGRPIKNNRSIDQVNSIIRQLSGNNIFKRIRYAYSVASYKKKGTFLSIFFVRMRKISPTSIFPMKPHRADVRTNLTWQKDWRRISSGSFLRVTP